MRTDILQATIDKFENPAGLRAGARLTFFKNRFFFKYDDLVQTYASSFAEGPGIQANPLPQDAKYITGNDRVLTAYAHPTDGYLYFTWTDHADFKPNTGASDLTTNKSCRPAIYTDANVTRVYYYDDVAGSVRRATVDITKVGDDFDVDCITNLSTCFTHSTTYPCLHAIGDDDLILLDIYEGGIRVKHWKYITDTWVESTWQNRFMHPTHVYDNNEYDDIYLLNYSAAVLFNGRVLVYFSGYDGNVLGVERAADGSWSDSFEPIPADLSKFAIANAIIANGRVHLCGQFQRVDPQEAFSTTYVYNLLLWSDTGRTFSLDRFTLFSIGDTTLGEMGLRFFATLDTSVTPWVAYFTDANRHVSGAAPHWLAGEAYTDKLVVADAIEIKGNPSSSWTLTLVAGDDTLVDNPLVQMGCVVAIDIGALSSDNSLDYARADLAIVSGRRLSRKNGLRSLQIDAIPYSLWKAGMMTHPFYLEIQSKQSLYTDLAEIDYLYNVTEDDAIPTHFMVDFWDEGTLHPKTHVAGVETDIETDDLRSSRGLVDYPVISSLPITLKVYGWSRAGTPTPYTGGDDDRPSDPAAPNDNIAAVLNVEHADGTTEEIVFSTPDVGSQIYWPQTFDVGAHGRGGGSYPVQLVGDVDDGLVVGDKIITAGVRVSSTATNSEDTVYYVERLEIPEVLMNVVREAGDTWSDLVIPPPGVDADEPFDFEFLINAEGWLFETYGPSYNGAGSWTNGKLWCEPIDPDLGYNARWYYMFPSAGQVQYRFTWRANKGVEINECHMTGFSGVGYYNSPVRSDESHVFLSWTSETFSVQAYFSGYHTGKIVYGMFYDGSRNPNQPVWIDDFHIVGLVQQQLVNCNLTLVSAGRYCQYHDDGVQRYRTGMDDFVIHHMGNDVYHTIRLDYPANLGEGQLAMLFQLVEVGPSTTNPQIQLQDPYEENPMVDNHNPAMAFNVGEEKWYVSTDDWRYRKSFNQYGHFKVVAFSNEYAVEDAWSRWKMKRIEWRGLNGVTTVLWNNTDCETRVLSERDGQSLQKFGVPTVMLATKPYSTFNFQAEAEYQVAEIGSWGGVVGLAKDGKNYIAARASTTAVQLLKVRDRVATILAETARTNGTDWWIHLEHKDGTFNVRMRDLAARIYDAPILTYNWTEADGPLAVDADLLHVGSYGLIDTPWVRIVGFDPKISTHIGVMPGGSFREVGDAGFPDSGVLVIDGVHYTYTSKRSTGGEEIRGPFQCRNTGLDWDYTESGEDYQGNALEFTLFEWLSNASYHNKYANWIMGGNSKYNWLVAETDFHPWIRTAGERVYLKNRSRHFGSEVEGNYHGYQQKMWLTEGFSGVVLAEETDVTHEEGAVAYLDRNGYVTLTHFAASSGHEDATVEDMLEKILQLAGGKAAFPGDKTHASQQLTGTFWSIT